MGSLKSYPRMKDSGLPWLGEIPEHWPLERAKRLFRRMDRPVRDSDEVVTCFRDGMVTLRKNRRLRGFTEALKEIGYQGIRRGDLVIHAMDAFAGAIGVSDSDGKGTPVYSVCAPLPGVNSHYYAYATREMARSQWIQALAKGIRERSTDFRYADFGSQPVPVPPVPEQAAIVRSLAYADRRIWRYILAKKKLIALLEEEKQAIIHRAVTRGLDPNVRMKDSGVPWLGEIPAHWSLRRFKFLATINSGQVDPRRPENRDLALIAPNHIQSGTGRVLKLQTAAEQGADSGKYLVGRGQVIYSKIRPNLRKAAIAPCDCLCSADMYPMTHRTGDLSCEYLLLLLLSRPFTKFAVDASMRVAMPKVNREALADFPLWFPGAEEQANILSYVARESTPTDTAVTRLEYMNELLREYRTRLIADVVTGKLDVREAAARLPDEGEEQDLLEDVDDYTEASGEGNDADGAPEAEAET